MNRMDCIFKKKLEKKEKILILYFPIGDSIFDDSVSWAQKYFDNGCTVLEIGLPYENPCLDGKTVRDSMERALKQVNLDDVFETIAKIRVRCPNNILQIMTYHGNCIKYGYELFAEKCSEAGVDGVLCPDASPEQLRLLDAALDMYGIRNLRFSAYYLNEQIIDDLKKLKGGYIFQQAVNGGTGEQPTVSSQIKTDIEMIKNAGIEIPVCAGFGISNASQARQAIDFGADGVIIGSAIINHIISGDAEDFIKSLHDVM